MKNAFDSAHYEWNRKPIAFVGYGGVGAARAIEHLRGIAIELQLAPIKHEVNIAMEPFLGIRSPIRSAARLMPTSGIEPSWMTALCARGA
jgi:NAD(P)H-dependent FMN reductase